ncbi:hypothetical protein GOB91_29265 [Sinorhizobium meliloti]|nr:hypothetical protein [Sinorhizobium meliloti]MDW9732645.1 hypothetical protein [Sinorhizobium meliloti]
MAEIPFTQYLMPDGRKAPVRINRPDEISDKAEKIIEAGYRFECEVLTTGQISLTIAGKDGDEDIEVVPNGPEVPVAVDRMITRFADRKAGA